MKLKKYKFTFTFDESGQLTSIRNKKLSKWKRFKNTVKAIGKSLWSEWKDNPWKHLFMNLVAPGSSLLPGANTFWEGAEDGDWGDMFDGALEMTKTAATIASLVVPGANAAAVASMVATTISLIEAIEDGNALGIVASAFGIVGGAAGMVGSAAQVGSTANVIKTGANLGSNAIKAVDAGGDLIDAIDDGDMAGILGSGFAFIGAAAGAVSAGSEFANSVGGALGDGTAADLGQLGKLEGSIPMADGVLEGDLSHTIVSADTIDTINQVGKAAGQAQTVVTVGAAAIEGDAIGVAQGLVNLGSTVVAPDSALGTQLDVADKGLDVARIFETTYQTGAVPDYGQLFNSFTALGVAGANVRLADAPPPPSPTADAVTRIGDRDRR